MSALLDGGLDLLTGSSCVGCHRPGRLLCPGCAHALPRRPLAARPSPCPPGLAPCCVVGPYADPLRAMVLAHKERRAFALAAPLGELLAVAVGGLVDPDGGPQPCTLLVPVPSRPATVRNRGQDPMLRVSRRAAGMLRARGLRVAVLPLLAQRRAVADQAGLDAAARRDNLADSMAADTRTLRALARRRTPVRAVVCDDVLTTGATAREAQRALTDVGIPVVGVAAVAATVRRVQAPLEGTG